MIKISMAMILFAGMSGKYEKAVFGGWANTAGDILFVEMIILTYFPRAVCQAQHNTFQAHS